MENIWKPVNDLIGVPGLEIIQARKVECNYMGLHFEVDSEQPWKINVTEIGFGPPEGSTARDFFDALKPRDG